MNNICIHFSDFFGIEPEVVENYGAFNISLLADMPVFIDPFKLFASNKEEYNLLHDEIIKYLCFLRDYCISHPRIENWVLKELFSFPEVKNLYMGFSSFGNQGKGLGQKFAKILYRYFTGPLKDFGREEVTKSSHLEKLCVIASGVGRDFVSDFSANLIKRFLLAYTQDFARNHLKEGQCDYRTIRKVYFDYSRELWQDEKFYLPIFQNDYVLLAPEDILTRDETWISHSGLIRNFYRLPQAVEDDVLRGKLNRLLENIQCRSVKLSVEERHRIMNGFLQEHPDLADWYIKDLEDNKEQALLETGVRVKEAEEIFVKGTREAFKYLDAAGFYDVKLTSIEEARIRINHFKQFVENNDGYKLFYGRDGRKLPEESVQLAFRLLWYGSNKDVNREVNNGRGPADFKISYGNGDKCIIEIKWASNSKLKDNLKHQPEIYAKANMTKDKISVVLYTSDSELSKTEKILHDLGMSLNPNIVLINAGKKMSASNVKKEEDLFDYDAEIAALCNDLAKDMEFPDIDDLLSELKIDESEMPNLDFE